MMRAMRGLGSVKGLALVQPLADLDELQKRDDQRLKSWARQVGEERAQEALAVLRSPQPNSQGRNGGAYTLPELLAESWLRKRSVRHEAQFDLGWARPDFVLFDLGATAGGCMVWEIQGEYWHKSSGAHDAARKQRLLASTARGLPILAVVEVWEADIYQGEGVFDAAASGRGMRG